MIRTTRRGFLAATAAATGAALLPAPAGARPAAGPGAGELDRWLDRACAAAGIDRAAWDPRAGVRANKDNLERSYDLYTGHQLAARELHWAGMAGLAGSDFGGGLLDMDLGATVYALHGVAPTARRLLAAVRAAAGPGALAALPAGLRALVHATELTPADVHHLVAEILVMQKAIFADLMPLHQAYREAGDAEIGRLHRLGAVTAGTRAAWADIASGDGARIAAGNAVLLRREQETVIGAAWDRVRGYRGGLGAALTYAATAVGSPSVGGVATMRAYRPIVLHGTGPAGAVRMTLPLPDWDWSVLDQRWAYIGDELLPGYTRQVTGNWAALARELSVPQRIAMQRHRPMANLHRILLDAARVAEIGPDAGDAR